MDYRMARAVLALWESTTHPIDRALTLLATADPGSSRRELAELRLGERDARLLALWERLFGPEMVGLARCPKCGERLEMRLSAPQLRRAADAAVEGPHELVNGDVELRFRPLTSRDLAAAATAADGIRARRLLAERAVVEARRGNTPIVPAELPETVVDLLAERLVACDPGAENLIHGACPACRHAFSILLEVEEFLWNGVRVLGGRLLREIAVLARTYHFSESEILDMSRRRRRAYLELLGECTTS